MLACPLGGRARETHLSEDESRYRSYLLYMVLHNNSTNLCSCICVIIGAGPYILVHKLQMKSKQSGKMYTN